LGLCGHNPKPTIKPQPFASQWRIDRNATIRPQLVNPFQQVRLPNQRRLETADIRVVHVIHDRALGIGDAVRVIGFNGVFRALP